MKCTVILACVTLLFLGVAARPAQAQGGTYTVQPGDTLTSIAYGYGITLDSLLAANGLTGGGWVYAGQQLVIPEQTSTTSPTYFNYQPVTTSQSITVQPGDTLSNIAARYGVSVNQLAMTNGLAWNAWLYVGQTLVIPATTPNLVYNQPAYSVPVAQTAPVNNSTQNAERWIDVNLTTQTVTAYEGQTPIFSFLASTGTWQYPTVVGTYKIYVKHAKARMRGGIGAEAYDLPDVPNVMYFYRGYGLHGTYWHNNFGTQMSHGCVNLSISDSEKIFNWASVGTKVVTHY